MSTMSISIPQKKSYLRILSYLLFACLTLVFSSCESRRTIVNGLDEKEANEISVFLSQRGIMVNKVRSTEGTGGGGAKITLWDINVAEDQATEAMALLNQQGLPRRRGQSLLGLFQNVGLVPSEMQEKIRYQAGLAEQIANTIRKIDGVLDAEVQVSFPEEDPLNPGADKTKKITASVYVKHNGVLDDPNAHLVPRIKRLVSSSITGLDYDNVTVIGDRARLYEYGGTFTGSLEEEKPYVTVWSIVLAQDSLLRFRLLFFSFTLLLVLLLLSLIWVAWKIYPLLQAHGGFKELFHLHPIPLSQEEEKTKEEAPAKKGDAKGESQAQKTDEQGLVDEDIDET